MAQRAETTVTECSLTSCVSSRFLIGSHTMPGLQHSHSDFVGSRVYGYLGVVYHLHFWHHDQGLLRATAVTRGWNGHRIRVSTRNLRWRRKFSRRSCRDSNSQSFDHESGALTNELSRLPTLQLYLDNPPACLRKRVCRRALIS